jgi:hypothetical protein
MILKKIPIPSHNFAVENKILLSQNRKTLRAKEAAINFKNK